MVRLEGVHCNYILHVVFVFLVIVGAVSTVGVVVALCLILLLVLVAVGLHSMMKNRRYVNYNGHVLLLNKENS